MTDRHTDQLRDALAEADAQLDAAWLAGVGIEEALERARRLSEQLGRSELIEEAKVELARRHGYSPGEAYRRLVDISQRSNRKLRDAARDVLAERAGDLARLS